MTTPANTDLAGAVERTTKLAEWMVGARPRPANDQSFSSHAADLRLILTALASKEDQGASSAKSAARGPSDLMGSTAPGHLDERDKFEEWAAADNRDLAPEMYEERTPDNGLYYMSETTNAAYIGWRERASHSSQTEAPQPVHDEPKSADPEGAEVEAVAPVPMVLHCPSCGLQHIDEPSEGWDNPPHRSHLCHGCGTIWRPADITTVGVETIQTKGSADVRRPAPVPEDVGTVSRAYHDAVLASLQQQRNDACARVKALETQEAVNSHFVNRIQRALGDGPDGSNLEVLGGAVEERVRGNGSSRDLSYAADIALEIAGRIRAQVPVTKAYLTDNKIDPHFADVLLSHYLTFADELVSPAVIDGESSRDDLKADLAAMRERVERAEAALKPFAAIKPSSFYPEDGSEGERYQVICNMNGSGDFGGEDLARARSYFTQGGENG